MPFAHLTLATPDASRSAAFFCAAFGWRPIDSPTNAPVETLWLEIAPGQQLHLVEVAGFEPSPFEREFGRHVALFHDRADFLALRGRLTHLGAAIVEPLRATDYRRFFFRDPNGYLFEVIEAG